MSPLSRDPDRASTAENLDHSLALFSVPILLAPVKHLHELPPPTDDDVTALLTERRRHYTDVLAELAADPEPGND